MTNVLLSLRKAASSSFDVVTLTAGSLGNVAAVAEAHSSHWLASTQTQLAHESAADALISEQKAAQKVAEHLSELQSKLKDPAFKDSYEEALSLIREATDKTKVTALRSA